MSAESQNIWRECVDWFIRCRILDRNHRVTWPNADIFEFAQILRDGVLLCQLASHLSNGAVDLREVNLRPQLSQFLCLKNTCVFLQACQKVFGLPQNQLFEAWQLYKVTDFGKILQTLSLLSNSPLSLKAVHPGFPNTSASTSISGEDEQGHEYYNDEIYRALAEQAESRDLEEDDYSHGAQEDMEYGKIYDVIVTRAASSAARRDYVPRPKEEEFVPRDKREHCIKELLDTEANYVGALNMLLEKFYRPLRDVLSPDDHQIIFLNLPEIANIHTAFQSELSKSARMLINRRSPTSKNVPPDPGIQLGDVFLRWKPKFVLYSRFCSDMPKAQKRIEKLCSESSSIKQKIVECQADANQNRFRLQDLLSVPMQRVLKYHLLLKELVKNTDDQSEEKPALRVALDAMLDLSLYINEVKRDCETLQIIRDIQSSIGDLTMPENTDLSDYGRLLKDGEVRLCSHEEKKVKPRYVFIFDKVLMICKNVRANQYTYKNAIVLSDYQLEEPEFENNNRTFTLMKGTKNWIYSWQLVHIQGKNVFQMHAKSQEMKDSWIAAIRMAHDNVKPDKRALTDHSFQYFSFEKATECSFCLKLLRGLFYQGYKCQNCDAVAHKECIESASGCGQARPPRPIQRPVSFNQADSFIVGQRLRAIKPFHQGNNGGPEYLFFNENDVIEVISVNTGFEGWWKGIVIEGTQQDRVGMFPSEYVRKIRTGSDQKISRCETWHAGRSPLDSPVNGSPLAQNLPQLPPHRTPSTVSSISTSSTLSTQSTLVSPSSPRTLSGGGSTRRGSYVNLDQLDSFQWYLGQIDRTGSEAQLKGMPTGTFLVRYSEKQGQYAISIAYDNEVKHVKVEEGPGGYWLDEGTPPFPSIVELIQYYEQNNMQESFNLLNTQLRIPLKAAVVANAVARHNFEATAPNMISLKRGDTVVVLSKNGSDRGWWKGKVDGRVGYFPLAYVEETEGLMSIACGNRPPPSIQQPPPPFRDRGSMGTTSART